MGMYELVCKRINTNIPNDIMRLIVLFSNEENNQWIISVKEIKTKLLEHFSIIEEPVIKINEYKFILKLKKICHRLHFGSWYQGMDEIVTRLRQHFKIAFTESIADEIVQSFQFVIDEEQLDDIDLIHHVQCPMFC